MTRKSKIVTGSVTGFLILVGLINLGVFTHHSSTHAPHLNVSHYVPYNMTHSKEPHPDFTEKSFPQTMQGVYASSAPVNTPSLQRYYQIVSLVRITPSRLYQQIAIIPKQQPKRLNKKVPRNTNKSKRTGSQFIRQVINRETQKKNIVRYNVIQHRKQQQQNSNQANVMNDLHKNNRLHKHHKHTHKVKHTQQLIPFQARSIMNRSHIRSLVAGINDEVEPGNIVSANGGGYNIQLKDVQRLDGFNPNRIESMGIPANLIVPNFNTISNINVQVGHHQFKSKGYTFKKISRKQAMAILNQSNISDYFLGL